MPNPIEIDDFRGLYSWYDESKVPLNHFIDCLNLEYYPGGFNSRKGIELLYDTSGTELNPGVRRMKRFEIPGSPDRILVLIDNFAIYDASVSFDYPILVVTGMTDFSCVSLYGRAYISPHNGDEGLADVPLYVYDPSVAATARIAAGDPPSDFELSVATTNPTVALADVASAQTVVDTVALTLTTSPYVPPTSNTIKFTMVAGTGTITQLIWTVVGYDAAFQPATEVYVNKTLSAGPLTFTTVDMWSSITSITPSGMAGAIGTGTIKVEVTGKPPGKIERGYHIIAIAYETASGFITRPGPAAGTGVNFAVFLTTKAKKALTVSGIPAVPPTGTIKIHILSSKLIVKNRYTGNPNEYELFFVPATSGGIIDPVGPTSRTINFFDADLVDSADFLKDNMARIPAGVALLATSKGRLLIAGLNSTSVVGDGEQDELSNNTVVFASVGGEPEAFSMTDGFVIVKPGGEGIRNLAEYRGLIYPYKGTRTYVTQDNGGLPSTWEINSIDDAIGAECHGVSIALGSDSSSEDSLIVASKSGLQIFNGTFADRPLSWKIREIWDAIAIENKFNQMEVALDPVNKFIFVSIPFPVTVGPGYLSGFMLYADYSNGLDWENIKWCPWVFYREGGILIPTTIFTTFENGQCVLRIGSIDENIYTYQYNEVSNQDDDGEAKISYFETAKLDYAEAGGVSNVTMIRLKIDGGGLMHNTLIGPEAITSETLPDENLGDGSANLQIKVNFSEDDFSYKALTNDINDNFRVSKIWVFGDEEWAERPQ